MCIRSDSLADAVQNLIDCNLLKLEVKTSPHEGFGDIVRRQIGEAKLKLNRELHNHIVAERKLVAKKIYDAIMEMEGPTNGG